MKKDNTIAKRKITKGRTNNDLQKLTYKTKDRVTRTPLKTRGELGCSERVSSFCSTSGTRRVNLVTNMWQVMNEERTGKCLWQVEHICGDLWHRYSKMVNQVMENVQSLTLCINLKWSAYGKLFKKSMLLGRNQERMDVHMDRHGKNLMHPDV